MCKTAGMVTLGDKLLLSYGVMGGELSLDLHLPITHLPAS